MKKTLLSALLLSVALVACSKEEEAPLPDLPKVELPEGLAGLYSGRLPCDNCKVRMVRMNLAEDRTAEVVETLMGETMKVDTLKGTFDDKDGVVSLVLSEGKVKWSFKRGTSGSLDFMTSAGSVYEDADGMKASLIRIYNMPTLKKHVKADSAENK